MYNSFTFQLNDKYQKDTSELIQNKKNLFNANMAFFSRVLPDLKEKLDNCKNNNYSLFVNADSELNIFDNTSGEALYGKSPILEVKLEVESFFKKPVSIFRETSIQHTVEAADGLPANSVVLVFGIGCGYHIRQLLLSDKLAALLIYEAEVELLKHSLNFIVWQDILELANQKKVLLAIQPDFAVANIKQHLAELDAAGLFKKKIYIYRHTFNLLTEEVIRFLIASSGNSAALLQGEGRFLGLDPQQNYLPVRTAGILGNFIPDLRIPQKSQARLVRNLAALKAFYPDIASFYENFKAKRWVFCLDENQEENIYHIQSRTFAYRASKQDSESLACLFMQNPFQDSAVYTQSYQAKLEKYIHFQQIAKVESLQKQLPKVPAFLKENIRTLAFFGTGLARHIERTVFEIEPRNVFIFEEDPELFYASLYSTDWAGIIERANSLKGHLYFNIGCKPDSYLNYFLQQLYIIGAYEVSNTYIFPCYFRPHLQKAIGDLRQQLKTFIALNEYYDNSRYSFTHFIKNAESKALFYQSRVFDGEKHDFPVFIVGNGPSLDELFEYIVEYQEKAIIISCGTALKALYEYGITPDFHAEVEQNGATYNWINQVPDKKYLKSIKLLSTAAVHPETAKLFDTACLAFTFGQTPLKLLNHIDSSFAEKMCTLKYAFPTVSNFAINIALSLRFKEIYLFGVDLGFSNIEHHHSKKSAYYTESGSNVYDYAKSIGHAISVQGNFLPFVGTKFEFNMARRVMEQAIEPFQSTSHVYNCSNGAFIKGATPLYAGNLLIKGQAASKKDIIKKLLVGSFTSIPEHVLISFKNELAVNVPLVNDFIDKLLQTIPDAVFDKAQAIEITNMQNSLIRSQYADKNLLSCYLLEGSIYSFLGLINSFAAALDDTMSFELLNQLLKIWQEYLILVKSDLAMLLKMPCPVANLSV